MLDIYPPPMVAHFAAEAGVSDQQLASMRKDFFDTQVKIAAERARAATARIELGRELAEPKPDAHAIARRVDEQAQAHAEVAKLWITMLQRTRNALTPEQRAKLDQARQQAAAWAMAMGASSALGAPAQRLRRHHRPPSHGSGPGPGGAGWGPSSWGHAPGAPDFDFGADGPDGPDGWGLDPGTEPPPDRGAPPWQESPCASRGCAQPDRGPGPQGPGEDVQRPSWF